MTNFKTLGLSEPLVRAIVAAGYTNPTPIQTAAIPTALSGRDLVGCAQTGTGKTAAFVLPMLDRLASRRTGQGFRSVRALVVTPTRELALQVEESVRTYGKFTGLRSLAIFGGVGMGPQLNGLRRGADIVVATPGRLLDHVDQGTIDLSQVEILVLDEADRMFDMGFLKDVRKIVSEVPKQRQTLLFSATMPEPIQVLAASILTNPERVEIGERRNPAETVMQHVYPVSQEQKLDLLLHILRTEPVESVIVFSRTKHRADKIARKLGQHGFAVDALHSNRTQNQRQRTLAGFKSGKVRVLVATDIAARGIDVDNISHVINFDTPNQAEDYIHRIGRTGRAQATGDAITFVARDEEDYLRDIERHTGKRLARKSYAGFEAATVTNRAESFSAEERESRPNGEHRSGNQQRPSGNRSGSRSNGYRSQSRSRSSRQR
jgi:ATP-dependent RNA helicase RhlE